MKGRGYAGWPGIWAYFLIGSSIEPVRIKIISTIVIDSIINSNSGNNEFDLQVRNISYVKFNNIDILQVVCKDGSILGITELQPSNKKIMKSR
jgi:methionyl-tRNA formyltransferase